jgi:hypothetical protein
MAMTLQERLLATIWVQQSHTGAVVRFPLPAARYARPPGYSASAEKDVNLPATILAPEALSKL